MGGVIQAVVQNYLLYWLFHAVGMRTFGAGKTVQEPIGAVELVVPADLIELLAGVAHNPAGFRDILQFSSKL